MYRELFKREWAIKRYLSAPRAEECEEYLRMRSAKGCSLKTLQKEAILLRLVVKELGDFPVITLQQIHSAANRWARRQHRLGKARTKSSRDYFTWLAKEWCQYLGCLEEPLQAPDPFSQAMTDFTAWLNNEQGLSSETIQSYCRHVRLFLNWYQVTHPSQFICDVQLTDIDTYLAFQGDRGWARTTLSFAVSCLRSFFRHMSRLELCKNSIADGIQGPRIYSQENLPMGPAWEDVNRLLSHMGNERACDIRDKAIIMLCAMYGFRRSEVAALKLDDIDWERNLISIWRPKQRSRQTYPLVAGVGNAIIQYLKMSRPESKRRELFLMLTAPYGPVSGCIIYAVVSSRIKVSVR